MTDQQTDLAAELSDRATARDERWTFGKWKSMLMQEANRVGETVDEGRLVSLYAEGLSVRDALGRMNKK